jgi:hypothetical protein
VYTFGQINQVSGTRYFTVPILRVEGTGDGGSFSSGGRGNEEHNRLIVDSMTGRSRAVLPDTKFELVRWIEPNAKASNIADDQIDDGANGSTKSSGLYAAVVKRPGKTDKQAATYDILLGHFEDGQQAWVARGLGGVQAVWLNTNGKLAVVAAGSSGGTYQLYDPKSFRPVLRADLKIQ